MPRPILPWIKAGKDFLERAVEKTKRLSLEAFGKIREGERGWSLFRGLLPGSLLGALIGGIFGAIAGALIGFMVDQTFIQKDAETRIVEALQSPEKAAWADFFPGSLALAGLSVWWMGRLGGPTPPMMDFARDQFLGVSGGKSPSEADIERILRTAALRAATLDGKRLASAYGLRSGLSTAALPAELLFGLLRESGEALTPRIKEEIWQLLSNASVTETDASAREKKYFPEYRDPYELLGLPQGAGCEEAKKSFRRLSMVFHPDANPSLGEEQKKASEEAFIAIKEAYAQIMALSPGDSRKEGMETKRSEEGYSA